VSVTEALNLEQEHELHDRLLNLLAHSTSVRDEQVVLQDFELIIWNCSIVKCTKSGIDTIDRFITSGHSIVEVDAAFADEFDGFGRKFDRVIFLHNLLYLLDAKVLVGLDKVLFHCS
jgi:hypothetical protein